MADSKWLMFNLDGSPQGHDLSLEKATQRYLLNSTVSTVETSPDGKPEKWTYWRFSNGAEIRYEEGRICLLVPATLIDGCAACGRSG